MCDTADFPTIASHIKGCIADASTKQIPFLKMLEMPIRILEQTLHSLSFIGDISQFSQETVDSLTTSEKEQEFLQESVFQETVTC